MKSIKKINLDRSNVSAVAREYLIKNNATGKYLGGITYEFVMERVPGKKRKERVTKLIVWESEKGYLTDIEDTNNMIDKIVRNGLGAILDTCEILSFDKITVIEEVGKLNLKTRKEKFEQEHLIRKLKGE